MDIFQLFSHKQSKAIALSSFWFLLFSTKKKNESNSKPLRSLLQTWSNLISIWSITSFDETFFKMISNPLLRLFEHTFCYLYNIELVEQFHLYYVVLIENRCQQSVRSFLISFDLLMLLCFILNWFSNQTQTII